MDILESDLIWCHVTRCQCDMSDLSWVDLEDVAGCARIAKTLATLFSALQLAAQSRSWAEICG